jgi:hypothetical protein
MSAALAQATYGQASLAYCGQTNAYIIVVTLVDDNNFDTSLFVPKDPHWRCQKAGQDLTLEDLPKIFRLMRSDIEFEMTTDIRKAILKDIKK